MALAGTCDEARRPCTNRAGARSHRPRAQGCARQVLPDASCRQESLHPGSDRRPAGRARRRRESEAHPSRADPATRGGARRAGARWTGSGFTLRHGPRSTIPRMVRREDADGKPSGSCCSSPAGASPASVSAGAPSSRPQARPETAVARAGCQKPLRREQVRGPQHEVKPAASTDLQPESRAGHVTAKATSPAPRSGGVRAGGLGGVWGAARGHGGGRNTRGPSAQPGSGQRVSHKAEGESGSGAAGVRGGRSTAEGRAA